MRIRRCAGSCCTAAAAVLAARGCRWRVLRTALLAVCGRGMDGRGSISGGGGRLGRAWEERRTGGVAAHGGRRSTERAAADRGCWWPPACRRSMCTCRRTPSSVMWSTASPRTTTSSACRSAASSLLDSGGNAFSSVCLSSHQVSLFVLISVAVVWLRAQVRQRDEQCEPGDDV